MTNTADPGLSPCPDPDCPDSIRGRSHAHVTVELPVPEPGLAQSRYPLPYQPWERTAWEQAAERAGLPLREWLRRSLLQLARYSEHQARRRTTMETTELRPSPLLSSPSRPPDPSSDLSAMPRKPPEPGQGDPSASGNARE
jgi:hypothetical protein